MQSETREADADPGRVVVAGRQPVVRVRPWAAPTPHHDPGGQCGDGQARGTRRERARVRRAGACRRPPARARRDRADQRHRAGDVQEEREVPRGRADGERSLSRASRSSGRGSRRDATPAAHEQGVRDRVAQQRAKLGARRRRPPRRGARRARGPPSASRPPALPRPFASTQSTSGAPDPERAVAVADVVHEPQRRGRASGPRRADHERQRDADQAEE